MPTTTAWLTGLGGAAFVGAMGSLGWMLRRAWRRALNVRHSGTAVRICGRDLVRAVGRHVRRADGGTRGLGRVLRADEARAHDRERPGVGLAHGGRDPDHAAADRAPGAAAGAPREGGHRVADRRGRAAARRVARGLDARARHGGRRVRRRRAGVPRVRDGGAAHRTPWAVPAAAFHMLAAFAWFVAGSIGLAIALFDGAAGADRYREVFLTAFVGGWLVQVLLGAWSYLLPMAKPGHPTERRRWLWVFELAAPVQVALLNAGLLLLAGRGAGWLGSRARPGRRRPRVHRRRDRAREGVAVRGGRLARRARIAPAPSGADDATRCGPGPVRGSRARSISPRTRRSISSRIGRTSSAERPAGSSSSQSRYRTPGKTGQASPHPIVTTASAARTTSSVQGFGNWALISIPISAIASIAAGFTSLAGFEPPEKTSAPSPPDAGATRPPSASAPRCARRGRRPTARRT